MAVTIIAPISSTIFSWKEGFSSERAGSPVIRIDPVRSSTTSVGQTQGR